MADEEYEVEGVSGRRIKQGTTEYLLRWKGYVKKTWTPITDCDSCKMLIDDFDRRNPPSQAMPRVTTGEKASTKNSGKRGRMSKSKDGDDSNSKGKSKSTAIKKTRVVVSCSMKTQTSADPNLDDSDDNEDSVVETTIRDGGLAVPTMQREPEDPSVKLDEALTALLTSEPFIPFVQPAKQHDGKRGDAIVIRMPPKILKSEDLPEIEVYDEKTYTDQGYSITTPSGEVEMFADREVMNIVGYVPDDTRPFVLVKLDFKKDENKLKVKDAVQAVHCPLAESLFRKAYKAYMDRVAPRSQPPSDTSGTTAGPSGSTGSTAGTAGTSDGAGPSRAATPEARGTSGQSTGRSID